MDLTGAQKFENLCKRNGSIWMGIINLTPDSFSDGGKFNCNEKALKRAFELVKNGAQILDVGGVSTRPFSELIESERELQRVYETICYLKKQLPNDILISIDSFSPYVTNVLASEGLIDIINDQFSARCEEEISYESTLKKRNTAQIAAQYELGYIIMHMQGSPGTMQVNPVYENCGKEVLSFLKERIHFVEKQGVKFLAVDPGIGFGKSVNNNLELISQSFISSLSELNKSILVGLSRKWFLGQLNTELTEPHSRDKVTKEYEMKCISRGVKIIRSHIMPSES
jgi:dihydropteroate synthase